MTRHRLRARRGYTLVFFAMFLFGFMALAALVIDVGFARLAQRQMQTAVDAAALEGLRFRDEVPERLVNEMVQAGVNLADASDPEYARRWLASRIVALTFDDNLNPDDDDLIGFGAGPVVELGDPIPGAEDLNAGQLLPPQNTRFYKPVLQLNTSNQPHGDMVAGRYTAGVFEPDISADAFLVQMRRTNDFEGLYNEPGVSSHGPAIPFLFGLGAFLPARDPNTAYSPRHHGMTVRATAIADARRVLSVGMPNFAVMGLVEFALDAAYWNDHWTDEDAELELIGGEIFRPINDEDKELVGRFYKFTFDPRLDPLVIGREIPAAQSLDDGLYEGYVPIYDEIPAGSGVIRVVGFSWAKADVVTNGNQTVTITRYESKIAARNASAIVCYEWDETIDDLNAVLTALLEANRNLRGSLLAPVLVR